MSAATNRATRAAVAGALTLLLTGGVIGGLFTGTASADSAPASPADVTTPTTVTADALPTVQIDGVVWSQVVVGNTVYVAGKFTRARPAGAAAGTQETVRNNLLAYDIRTGQLLTSFAPDLNAQAMTVTASPDGSRIYVGGDFSQANGQTRYRVAAYSTATGALIAGFAPSFNARVNTLAATDTTVYVGGTFSAVGSTARTRLAAVAASNGALLPFSATPGVGSTAGNGNGNTSTSDAVRALVVTGGGTQVVAAGSFDSLNGQKATGVGALDPVTGATRPFAINRLLTNQGVNSAIYSLSTDGRTVYGTAFDYYGPGNLEGSFAATADGGAVQWINDCHGDTYSSFPSNGALYMATHAHVCSNIGGYPEETTRINKFATAVSLAASGTVGTDTIDGNAALVGQPAPALLNWFPTLNPGTYTGQNQAGWSVSANSEYVVFGGEFPSVNGAAQQGLVRFAVPAIAPNKIGPTTDGLTPTVTALSPGTARVSWTASSDRDNSVLTYRVYRDGNTTTPVYEVTRSSTFWDTPALAFVDTGVSAGSHTYRVTVSDPWGNRPVSGWVPVTVTAGTSTPRVYASTVVADGAQSYWPLGESSGTAYDWAGGSDLNVGTGVTRSETGALKGDANTAYQFRGTSSGLAATQRAAKAPNTFTAEAWFSTTTRNGGKIIGYGNKNTGTSGSYDRHVYMDSSGRLYFGVHSGSEQLISTTTKYNDGKYHHVVAELGAQGMALYVDGKLVAAKAGVTSGQAYSGYWRIGGDSTWGGNGTWFNGRVDEVAVYPTVLTSDVVASHYSLGTTGKATNVAPTAAFTSAATYLATTFDASASVDRDGTIAAYEWAFGDGRTATGVTAAHTYAAAGTYPVTLTVTDDDGARTARTLDVTVAAEPPNVLPTAAFTATGSALTGAFDASASADADGSVTAWFWTFGDGTTGTGRTVQHTWTADGTYPVTLTVTDDDGATASTTQQVTVAAPAVYATDGFSRTTTSGLGTADTGGAWTASAPSRSTVSNGAGHLQTGAGQTTAVYLDSVSQGDVAVQATLSLDSVPTGGSAYVSVVGRHVGTNDYRLVTRFQPDGRVTLTLSRMVNGTQTDLKGVFLPGTYTPGSALLVRFDVSGSGTATLAAKAWLTGTTEPAAWQVSATDDTAALQRAGSVGLSAYVSGLASTAIRVDADDVWAGRAGQSPAATVNRAPIAAFTEAVTGLGVSVDAAGSADADGIVTGFAWDFGDGATGVGTTATHSYTAAGTYRVRLTVTDEDGATGTSERSVTVTAPPANQAPTAAFTSAVRDLAVTTDGSGSTDPDGSVTGWAWEFGDGGTDTGATPSHTYAAAGTYRVTLTVSDAAGARATVAQDVTVTAPAAVAPLAADAFSREVMDGWGTADAGGAWTTSGGTAAASVTGGRGVLTANAGHTTSAVLAALSSQDVALQTSVVVPQATGGGTYLNLSTRRVGTSEYRLKVWFRSTGEVQVIIVRVVDNVETALVGGNLPGTYAPGSSLTVRFDTAGSGTTTLRAKAWVTGTAEPTAWTLSRTDATAALQRPGAVSLVEYVAGTATAASTVLVDDLWVGAAGSAPTAG